ncbi:MAG: 2-amino-4-hydroxy-6-hydroxymethyldihydropteridine diphosphokinase [Candidatus Competibacteraceae bacterium]|nr:MAG: 2-amino-4-hydroxy-6-hydroxymethyldihydropteridine diphosphokinase [Candidatus Competibacteraceae bacterium]
MQPARAYIGIGSNLDDPIAHVRRAIQDLTGILASSCVAQSPLYRTAPIGGPPDQPDYINAVVALDTGLTPQQLLTVLQTFELAHGRTRTVHWGARTLDLDLLLYDQLVSADPWLTLPHPRLHQRAFVLYPLYDIAPALFIPGRGLLTTLLANCPTQTINRLDSDE